MSKSARLTTSDLRSIFRLLGDVRDLQRSPELQRRTLVDGLAKLVGAQSGLMADWIGFLPGQAMMPSGVALATDFDPLLPQFYAEAMRVGDARPDAMADIARRDPKTINVVTEHQLLPPDVMRQYKLYSEFRPLYRLTDVITAYFRHDGNPSAVTGVGLHRIGKRERPFGAREAALVRFFFEELKWLHETGRLQPPNSAGDRLTPRQRQVLHQLLDGRAPKQIAASLELSLYTVRDYIKHIYRTYDVSGREELTARFMQPPERRADPNGESPSAVP